VTVNNEEESKDTSWLLHAAAKPQLVRDTLRRDRGLVKLLAANGDFLDGFFCSPEHLMALLDANERLGKDDVDYDGLLDRINAGSDGAAASVTSQSARLARDLRTLVADKEGRVFRVHPELIANIAGNEAFAESLAGYDRVWEALLKKGKERFGGNTTLRQRIDTALGKIIRFSYGGTFAEPDVGWEAPQHLIKAAVNGDLDSLKKELANPQIDLNHGWKTDGTGWTALMYAARTGHADCARALLADSRIDPNRGWNADGSGWTALMCAANNGHADCVRALLTHSKIDPNRGRNADGNGMTALIDAATNGHVDCVKALVEDKRTDPTRSLDRNDSGLTARELARRYGRTACEVQLANAERQWSMKYERHGRG
jgi:hypothetical protein